MRQLFGELKRRNVYKVAVTYVVAAFVVLQLADLAAGAFDFPGWFEPMIWVVAGLGFPIALVVAWAFELTPEGVRRTTEVPEGEGASETESMSPEERRSQSRLAMKALVGLGLVAAAVAGGWYLVGSGGTTVSDRSVAVLPFEAQGQEESGTFTAGMHAALSSRLGNVSDLRVSPSRAVQAFEDTVLSMAEIAGELGVAWMVTGNVQSTEDEVQVIVELVDPTTGTQRWSDDYTRDLTTESLFDLQGEISREIAQSLEVQLTAGERERIERRPTEDLQAYKLYVQGRSRLDTRTEEGIRDGVDYFRRAIEQDSSYALAWSGLADAISLYSTYGPDSVPSTLPNHEAARRALELDPDLAEAHASMGNVYMGEQRGPDALRELQRAVELKPSYAQAHHWLGIMELVLGRLARAHEHLSMAVKLNPRHTTAQTAFVVALIAEGEWERAHHQLGQIPEDQRQVTQFQGTRANLLYHEGRWEELEQMVKRFANTAGDQSAPEFWFYRNRLSALRGDTAGARDHLAAIQRTEGSGVRWNEGLLHAGLGETEDAFAAWEEVEEWEIWMVWALRYYYPDLLGPLREDPRYRELIRELNRQWGLNPDGSLPDSVEVAFGAETDE